MVNKAELAVVIPAYKASFLQETLNSLARQSDKRFNVYIGNDAGPSGIDQIIQGFKKILNIKYVRFKENVGGHDLVAQWERCVELSGVENYIWILPDDDTVEKDCVGLFLKEIEVRPKLDVYRFNTNYIDDKDQILNVNPIHPAHESAYAYVEARLKRQRNTSLGEHIFSREIYNRVGFRHFPLAWCADDVAWIEFGQKNGIKLISDSSNVANTMVNIRVSAENISSIGKDYSIPKLNASLEFLLFILEMNNKQLLKPIPGFKELSYEWFWGQMEQLHTSVRLMDFYKLMPKIKQIWGDTHGYYYLLRLFFRQKQGLVKIKKFIRESF